MGIEMKRKDVPGIGIRRIQYQGGQNGNVRRVRQKYGMERQEKCTAPALPRLGP
jgi:hypothetical protein